MTAEKPYPTPRFWMLDTAILAASFAAVLAPARWIGEGSNQRHSRGPITVASFAVFAIGLAFALNYPGRNHERYAARARDFGAVVMLLGLLSEVNLMVIGSGLVAFAAASYARSRLVG